MERKICKKCKKILPSDYKHHYCEACRNQHAQVVKSGFKYVLAGIGCVVAIVNFGKSHLKIDAK